MRKWMYLNFIFIIFVFSCESKSTPTIYPSRIGVDSAYSKLVKKHSSSFQQEEIFEEVEEDKPVEKQEDEIQKETELINNNAIVALSSDNTTAFLEISYGKAKTEVDKIAGQTNTFTFNSDTAKKIRIRISAQDSTANIRINQINGPVDSIKGGPFGKETIFNLPIKGIYQFSISENPTKSESYTGKYNIDLKLLWK